MVAQYGATDVVLLRQDLQVRLPADALPACTQHCGAFGWRLDCVLAHLADAHGWPHAALAGYAEARGVA